MKALSRMFFRSSAPGRALVIAALVGAFLSQQHAASAQGDADVAPSDAAQAAYRRGNEHAKAGRWAEALSAYEEAYRARQAWDIAGNLGIAEVETGRFAAGARHLDEALRGFPGSGKPEQRVLIDAAYQKALAKVGRLSVQASVPKAVISVDGEAMGVAPLAGPLFVSAGKHRVDAKTDGASATKDVEVAAGAQIDVPLELTSSSAATLPPGGEVEDETPVAAWVLVGAGATVAVTGGILLFVGLSSQSGAQDDFQAIGDDGGRCEPASSGFGTRCDEALSSASTGNALAATGGILLGVGAAAAIGGVVWVATSGSSSDSARVQLRPVLGRDTAGLWMRGTY